MTINRNDLSSFIVTINGIGDILDAVTKKSTGQNASECFKIIREDKNNTLSVENNKITGECGQGYGYKTCKACVDAVNKSVYSFDNGEYACDYYSVI